MRAFELQAHFATREHVVYTGTTCEPTVPSMTNGRYVTLQRDAATPSAPGIGTVLGVVCEPGYEQTRGRSWEVELCSIFSHKNHKMMHIQNTNKRNKFHDFFFWKIFQKRGKIGYFSRADCKMRQLCKFAQEAQENFVIFSLKYGHRGTQHASRS